MPSFGRIKQLSVSGAAARGRLRAVRRAARPRPTRSGSGPATVPTASPLDRPAASSRGSTARRRRVRRRRRHGGDVRDGARTPNAAAPASRGVAFDVPPSVAAQAGRRRPHDRGFGAASVLQLRARSTAVAREPRRRRRAAARRRRQTSDAPVAPATDARRLGVRFGVDAAPSARSPSARPPASTAPTVARRRVEASTRRAERRGRRQRSSPVGRHARARRPARPTSASASSRARRTSTAPLDARRRRNRRVDDCRDLTPGDADRRPAATTPSARQRRHRPSARRPRHVGRSTDGRRRRSRSTTAVTVTDWAGNATSADGTSRPRSSTTSDLGSPTPDAEHRHERRSTTPSPQRQRTTRQQQRRRRRRGRSLPLAAPVGLARRRSRCASPSGVPVLQYGKRYRFNGRLTCVVNGKRRSAPKRTRVDMLNKVGKKTVEKAGTTIRRQGPPQVILAYPSSRTAHLPLHQQRRAAVAGQHQDQGRRRRSPKR